MNSAGRAVHSGCPNFFTWGMIVVVWNLDMMRNASASSQMTLAQHRAILQKSVIDRLTDLQSQTQDPKRKDVLQQAIERAQAGKSS
jgi:hypothetical protein